MASWQLVDVEDDVCGQAAAGVELDQREGFDLEGVDGA